VTHRPKTELARDMLLRALDSGVTARWVTGDAVYGESFPLRWALEERGQGYVMAVSRKAHVWQGAEQRKVGICWKRCKRTPTPAGPGSAPGRVARDPGSMIGSICR